MQRSILSNKHKYCSYYNNKIVIAAFLQNTTIVCVCACLRACVCVCENISDKFDNGHCLVKVNATVGL